MTSTCTQEWKRIAKNRCLLTVTFPCGMTVKETVKTGSGDRMMSLICQFVHCAGRNGHTTYTRIADQTTVIPRWQK